MVKKVVSVQDTTKGWGGGDCSWSSLCH